MDPNGLKRQALERGLITIGERVSTYSRYKPLKVTVNELVKFLRKNRELAYLPDISLIFYQWITNRQQDFETLFHMTADLRSIIREYVDGFYKICPTDEELIEIELATNQK